MAFSEMNVDRDRLTAVELVEAWPLLSVDERYEGFRQLESEEADQFFLGLGARDQGALLRSMRDGERRLWIRLLAPDHAADAVQTFDGSEREGLLLLLDEPTRREVVALLAYEEDHAGGLMSPRYARLRPDMLVDEAIRYLRRQAESKLETLTYAYVLEHDQHLCGVVSLRQLFISAGDIPISEMMRRNVVSVPETMDQEAVARIIARHRFAALPVVNDAGQMQGIVTIDDIVGVVQHEATEDIHKLGGMEALAAPYMQTSLVAMIRKRAGWLSALFLGEMLTASAMGHFEDEIAKAVVLALFVPLIISSGGNSGSQATTLIIRAMALGEVRLRDFWHVIRKELVAGFALGAILAMIGLVRILVWQALFHTYGAHYVLVALTVAISLLGVVTWGALSGAMLPFLIRKLGFDPASASAPFVATLVDVSGLLIYFNVAYLMLRGTVL